jgi:hypothetical protein
MSTFAKDDCTLYNQADIDALNGPEFDNFAEILLAAYVEPVDGEPFQEELGIYRQEQEAIGPYKLPVPILSIINSLHLPEKPKPALVLENSRLFKRREERLEKERLEKERLEKELAEKNKTAGIVS